MRPTNYRTVSYVIRLAVEEDLPDVAKWYSKQCGLRGGAKERILAQFTERYRAREDVWQVSAWIVFRGKRRVCLVEVIAGMAYLLGMPAMMDDEDALESIWQAVLRFLFLEKSFAVVHTTVPAFNAAALLVMEKLGWEISDTYKDKSGVQYQYVCHRKYYLKEGQT